MRGRLGIIFFVALLLQCSLLVLAVEYPEAVGFVNDFADIIEPDYESDITKLLQDIEKNTTVELTVVTITSLEGLPIETYSIELAEKWKVGKEDKDNGLILLISEEDRKYRIEVGYGLEGLLPDGFVGELGRNILVPNFRNFEYGKGIYGAMQIVDARLTGQEEVLSEYHMKYSNQATSKITFWKFLIYIIIFIVLISFRLIFWPFFFFSGMGRNFGGGSGGFGSGGFGGFGGGSFGGGGSSGGW